MARAGEAAVDSGSRTVIVPARPERARGVMAVARLARMLRQLQRELGRAEERADAIAFEIIALKRALTADAAGRLTTITGEALVRARDARRLATREAALRSAATDGARKVEVRVQPHGGALVRVDDGKWFELPRMPTSLLRTLAENAAPGSDGLSEWQTFATVAEELARKTGKRLSRHALTQIVYRLRRIMTASGVNPYLVQVDRGRGLRLLVRR